jgi:hypothetical protein
MTVRTTLSVSTNVEDDLLVYLEQFNQANEDLVRDVMDDIAPDLLDELTFMPGTPASPFVWSNNKEANDRARRWWFWAISAGDVRTDGRHYIRTEQLVNGWSIEILSEGETTRVKLENPSSVLPLVQGSLAQNISQAGRFQIPGHRNTGWILVAITVNFWLGEAFPQDYEDALQDTVLDLVETSQRRRAFTRVV